MEELDEADASIWFAVPKSRISKSKKRIKNAHYALKPVKHMQVDEFGKMTLRHRIADRSIDSMVEKTRQAKEAASAPPPAVDDGGGDAAPAPTN